MATNKPGTNKEEASDPKAQNFQFCTRKCLQNVQSKIKKENVQLCWRFNGNWSYKLEFKRYVYKYYTLESYLVNNMT